MTDKESIEKSLNSIPLRFYKTIEDYCYTCHKAFDRHAEYKLKIDISQHEISKGVVKKTFKIFYETSSFSCGDSRKYIGKATGLGYTTLREAFEELKGYLDNER